MSVVERLINWFRRNPKPSTDPIPGAAVPAQPTETPAQPTSFLLTNYPEQPLFESADPVESLPDWLEDENLLRDEGTIFGLSNARPEEKIAMIRTYFQRQTAPLEHEVEQHNERIGELNLFIDQKENEIAELRHKTAQLEASQPDGDHQLPRTAIGLLFSVAMCIGNYYLIEETLEPVFRESRPIAVGIFMAGMFSLYGRTSAFHDPSTRLNARRVLEEAGLPFAASLFVFIQALQTQSAGRAIGLFIFIFFLFLLAGKLLLGTLTLLRNDLRYWSQGRQLKETQRIKTAVWETEIARLTAEINALRVQKWQVLPILNRADAELHRINARRDMLVKLFESEFNLARSLRDQLTESQRRAITGES